MDITGTIAQISLWMSRLQHLLRLHQIPKLLRMHQLPETAENAPTTETQTTQPPRKEVESQATPLPTPEEPSQQFRMNLHIRRRS